MMYPLVRELAGDGIPVTVTCRVLGIARQPYYRWLTAPVSIVPPRERGDLVEHFTQPGDDEVDGGEDGPHDRPRRADGRRRRLWVGLSEPDAPADGGRGRRQRRRRRLRGGPPLGAPFCAGVMTIGDDRLRRRHERYT
jgi:hypothetical protein